MCKGMCNREAIDGDHNIAGVVVVSLKIPAIVSTQRGGNMHRRIGGIILTTTSHSIEVSTLDSQSRNRGSNPLGKTSRKHLGSATSKRLGRGTLRNATAHASIV